MSLSDPQSVTIDGETTSLPRVSTGNNQSAYMSSDGLLKLNASHAYGKRTRRVVRLDHAKISSDVFIPSQNVKLSMSNYIVFDTPASGYTLDEAGDVWAGFKALVTGSSDAMIVALLGGQS
jgi:hypothetical protein